MKNQIYYNSNINLEEFIYILFQISQKLKISASSCDLLVKFIKTLLPNDNIIPSSYYKLIQLLNLKKLKNIKREYVCVYCNRTISSQNECKDKKCLRYKKNNNYEDPYLIKIDYLTHFKLVIEKNWQNLLNYRENSRKLLDITDSCNASFYKSKELCHFSISFLIFVDGASFTTSANTNQIWAILGIIIDLPPLIRTAYINIISFLFWGGHIINFNKVMKCIDPDFSDFLTNGVWFESLQSLIKINLFAIVADAPARAKIFMTKQYNGYFGCFHCLNEGKKLNGKHIYKYLPDSKLRTNDIYLSQVESAIDQNTCWEGIKGNNISLHE